MKKRIFKRASQFIGNTTLESHIDHWEWTKSRGLIVHYINGLFCKSGYSLTELLSSKQPEGQVIEQF